MKLDFKQKVDPAEIVRIKFIKPNHKRDLSPTRTQSTTKRTALVPTLPSEELHRSLYREVPSASLFTIVKPPGVAEQGVTFPIEPENSNRGLVNPANDTQDFPDLPDFPDLSDFPDLPDLPVPLTEAYAKFCDSDAEESMIRVKAEEVFCEMAISREEAEAVERATRLQNDSSDWKNQRRGRITASSFHDILVKKDSTAPDKLIGRLLEYNQNTDLGNIPAINWGRVNEANARQDYKERKQATHTNFTCTMSGLIINPSYPHLGASPDGLIDCSCCGEGLLEIKCPYSVRSDHPKDVIGKPGFFMKTGGLSRTHRYYTQVQGQLAISNRNYCDFVVWTPKGLILERIYHNPNFWEKLVLKLTSFFIESLLPEIMTHNLKNKLLEESRDEELDKTFCYCKGKDEGRMIGCSNVSCKIEWFHYKCVGIKRAPKGDWFCKDCTKH